MNFSFRPPNADYLGFPATKQGIVETTKLAEELGYDAVFLNDHLIVKSPHEIGPWANTFEPLATLGYLAACTERVRLGVSVLVMPYRNPIVTAKMIATLDQLSDGRMVMAVGAGRLEEEFDALRVPFRERGARTDEYLDVWRACWGPDPVTFEGEFASFSGMHCSPKPFQDPHPPIWIGGTSRPALRRAARVAAVWQPVPMPLERLLEAKAYLRQACLGIERPEPPATRMSFRVNISDITGVSPVGDTGERKRGHGDPAEIAADMRALADAGELDSFQVNFNGCHDLDQLVRSMTLFMREIAPAI